MNVDYANRNPQTLIYKHLGISDVRLIRLELTRLAAPDPKSGVSTNSTTSAAYRCKDNTFPAHAQENGQDLLFLS